MHSRVIMITFKFSRVFVTPISKVKSIYGRSSSVNSDCGENWSINQTIGDWRENHFEQCAYILTDIAI
jgi:hypothetical protein